MFLFRETMTWNYSTTGILPTVPEEALSLHWETLPLWVGTRKDRGLGGWGLSCYKSHRDKHICEKCSLKSPI